MQYKTNKNSTRNLRSQQRTWPYKVRASTAERKNGDAQKERKGENIMSPEKRLAYNRRPQNGDTKGNPAKEVGPVFHKPHPSYGSPPLPGTEKPSTRGHLLTRPVRRVRRWRPFCRHCHQGWLPGAGVARSHRRGGSGGGRESRYPTETKKFE